MITAKVVCNPLKEGYKTVFEEDFSCWQGIYVTLVLHLQDTGVLFVQHKCSANEMQVSCKWSVYAVQTPYFSKLLTAFTR